MYTIYFTVSYVNGILYSEIKLIELCQVNCYHKTHKWVNYVDVGQVTENEWGKIIY